MIHNRIHKIEWSNLACFSAIKINNFLQQVVHHEKMMPPDTGSKIFLNIVRYFVITIVK